MKIVPQPEEQLEVVPPRILCYTLAYDTLRPASSSQPNPRVADADLIRPYRNKKRTPATGSPLGPAGFFVAIRMHLDFSKSDGLIAAVVQDSNSGRVLMVGYMNSEAFRRTVETGFATFFSRSRQELWVKGETSGHRLVVKEISTDCDQDCLLVRVEPQGPGVCHNGYASCFYRRLENGQWVESEPRAYNPAAVYGSEP